MMDLHHSTCSWYNVDCTTDFTPKTPSSLEARNVQKLELFVDFTASAPTRVYLLACAALTASLNLLPNVKVGTVFASTMGLSPVFGLRTSRAGRSFGRNVPKPRSETLHPSLTDSTMTSRVAEMTSAH